jgi:hypothetical protein
MEGIMSLADATGFKVYDSQIEEFVSMDNMEKFMGHISEGHPGSEKISGLINPNNSKNNF